MTKEYQDEFLKINRDNLTYEQRRIRRSEINARKWFKRAKENHDPALRAQNGVKGNRQYEYIERKWNHNPELRERLWSHRTKDVRPEVRAAHLALGFLWGTPYRAMEHVAFVSPNWELVWKKVTKLGELPDTQENRDKFMAWADIPSTKPRSAAPGRNVSKDYTEHLSEPKPSILIKPTFKPLVVTINVPSAPVDITPKTP
jgi:hypothetical protein